MDSKKVIQTVKDKMKLTEIRLDMINDSKLADITFNVGKKKVETIYAHKAVLIMHSKVFARMFFNYFSLPMNIIIEDMEPDVFLEMLKFVYAGADAVNLTTKNMIDILYGAQKYILPELQSFCETFILENTNDSNILEVFDSSQYFKNTSRFLK
jgi:BTB/POZ domain-containing protein 3/6